MNEKDLAPWFETLIARARAWRETAPEKGGTQPEELSAIVAEMEAGLASVFGEKHPIRQRWAVTVATGRTSNKNAWNNPERFIIHQLVGVVEAAVALIKAGRVRGLVDGIRAETIAEVLEQGDALLAAGHTVAAMVLAGGALETHLLTLCRRSGCVPAGVGSIGAYGAALAQARNAGATTISAADSKAVTAWAHDRNDAAHSPTTFVRTKPEVALTVEGIRQFVGRTT